MSTSPPTTALYDALKATVAMLAKHRTETLPETDNSIKLEAELENKFKACVSYKWPPGLKRLLEVQKVASSIPAQSMPVKEKVRGATGKCVCCGTFEERGKSIFRFSQIKPSAPVDSHKPCELEECTGDDFEEEQFGGFFVVGDQCASKLRGALFCKHFFGHIRNELKVESNIETIAKKYYKLYRALEAHLASQRFVPFYFRPPKEASQDSWALLMSNISATHKIYGDDLLRFCGKRALKTMQTLDPDAKRGKRKASELEFVVDDDAPLLYESDANDGNDGNNSDDSDDDSDDDDSDADDGAGVGPSTSRSRGGRRRETARRVSDMGKQRKSNPLLLAKGTRVVVYWSGEDEWFAGVVKKTVDDEKTGELLHHVLYDDGEEFLVDLSNIQWRLEDKTRDSNAPAPATSKKRKRACVVEDSDTEVGEDDDDDMCNSEAEAADEDDAECAEASRRRVGQRKKGRKDDTDQEREQHDADAGADEQDAQKEDSDQGKGDADCADAENGGEPKDDDGADEDGARKARVVEDVLYHLIASATAKVHRARGEVAREAAKQRLAAVRDVILDTLPELGVTLVM